MFSMPCKLKKFLVFDSWGVIVFCNPENGFIFRASDIFLDFITFCEKFNYDVIVAELRNKYPEQLIAKFFKNFDTNKDFLLFDEANKKNIDSLYNESYKVLTLNLVHGCNLRCKYCFEELDFRMSSGIMTEDIALLATKSFISQLRDDVGQIIFTGGEPLLNFSIIKKIVSYVQTKNAEISYLIKTNGTLINKDILNFIVENKIKIQISIDGIRDSNDLNRVYPNNKGTFEDVMPVVYDFIENNYIHNVNLHGTVTHQTIQYLHESFTYLKSLHKDLRVDFMPVMDTKEKIYALTREDYKIYLKDYVLNKNLNITKTGESSDKICGIGVSHISVDTNGDVYPCYRLTGKQEYIMGNILLDGFNLNKIPQLSELYDLLFSSECGNCYAKSICRNGCYADKLLAGENFNCDFNEKLVLDEVIKESFSNINLLLSYSII